MEEINLPHNTNQLDDGMYPIPQPDELSTREKEDALGGYLMMFAAFAVGLPLPIINLIASVVYYFVNKGNTRFVRFHTLQALLSQIPTTILNAGFTFWTVRIIFFDWETSQYYWAYICMVTLANLWYAVTCIIGAIKARKGLMFYMLFFGIVAYRQVFTKSIADSNEVILSNRPPKM